MTDTSHDEEPRADKPSARDTSLLGRITAFLSAAGTVWILALMLLINSDVIGRFVFNSPIVGVPEIVSLSIVGIVFLQLSHTLRLHRFIRSDVLVGRLIKSRPRVGRALQCLHHLIGAGLGLLILWYVFPKFYEAWSEGTYLGDIGRIILPTWPILLIILIGSFFMTIQFFLHALDDAKFAMALQRSDATTPETGVDL
jgi:TRAP-type C4-dicarboxylate transport system permease small subunit